tara:strand:+ start:139081 stop:139878 length:798 start_codon:yes stop_codon:yes gene_type:complete
MNLTQQRFEGFLKTPVLWKSNEVYNLTQFQIDHQSISFDTEIDSKQRLGKYVERFVSHQLSNDTSIELIAENVQISKDKITLGELDCLLFQNGNPVHLEVIYKFYLFDQTVDEDSLQCWIGPNRKDRLIEKLEKLTKKQLPLLYSEECKAYLKSINLHSENISQQVYFKAQLFVPLSMEETQYKINPDCIVGFYINQTELKEFKDSKFYIPNKKDWLTTPHTNATWLNFEEFTIESNAYLEREFSPMCWIKLNTGELKKFFLVWW